eukprot:SAG25_NODE_10814_length_322_cov_0.695067_1_plen_106_part_11
MIPHEQAHKYWDTAGVGINNAKSRPAAVQAALGNYLSLAELQKVRTVASFGCGPLTNLLAEAKALHKAGVPVECLVTGIDICVEDASSSQLKLIKATYTHSKLLPQ